MHRVRRIRLNHCSRILCATLMAACSWAHADTGVLSVSAIVLSKSKCRFSSNAAVALNFGSIDPSSGTNATATATSDFSCAGSADPASFSITASNGLHAIGAGARRMQHGSVQTEHMAYSLSLSPAGGTVPKNGVRSLTITGTITPGAFGGAMAGAYSDTVAITLSP